MKFILILMLLSSCQKNKKKEFRALESTGIQIFENSEINDRSVESAVFVFKNYLCMAYDDFESGEIVTYACNNDNILRTLPFKARFFYPLVYNNELYIFFTEKNNIYAKKTNDLEVWENINNGEALLNGSKDPQSIYFNIWNTSVAVDNLGTFHFLFEVGKKNDDKYHVGLSYLKSDLNKNLELDSQKKLVVDIQQAGNAHIEFIEGKGLFLAFGALPTNDLDAIWHMEFATMGTKESVFKRNSKIKLGNEGLHVCDPSLAFYNNKIFLTYSYDQNSTHFVTINKTYSELYDIVNDTPY